jgi:hypothetical protein
MLMTVVYEHFNGCGRALIKKITNLGAGSPTSTSLAFSSILKDSIINFSPLYPLRFADLAVLT